MRLKNIFAVCLGIVACSNVMFINDAFASNLDTYRSLLEKRSYQIKYVEVTPDAIKLRKKYLDPGERHKKNK